MIVTLTDDEIELACLHAARRLARAICRGAKAAEGGAQPADDQRGEADFIGAMAEMAVAKVRGVYWSGLAKLGANDAGDGIEVR
jgi:hypothetical protein